MLRLLVGLVIGSLAIVVTTGWVPLSILAGLAPLAAFQQGIKRIRSELEAKLWRGWSDADREVAYTQFLDAVGRLTQRMSTQSVDESELKQEFNSEDLPWPALEEAVRLWHGLGLLAVVPGPSSVGNRHFSLTPQGIVAAKDPRGLDSYLRELQPSGFLYNIHINAPVGQLNAGDRQTIHNINAHISAVVSRGEPDLARALQTLGEVAISDAELDDQTRAEVLDTIDDLAEAAEMAPAARKGGRIKGAIAVIGSAAGTATRLREAWQEWGPVIEEHLLPS